MSNYALADLSGIATAFALFSTLAFFPGYLLGHLINPWHFRSRTFAFQLAASVSLSVGAGPLVAFISGRYAWPLFSAATIGALGLLTRHKPRIDKTVRMAACVGLGWSVWAALWLMDWQFAGRVYFPIYAFDYSTRAMFVHSLAAFGLPAQNPFFDPGHPVALHYHFLWLLECALVHGLAPALITARLALIAGAVWCGLGLMCVAALSMRILMHRRSWIVIGLLAVTGLDIIPAALILLGNRIHLFGFLPPSAEWWNEQVDGWIYTALWQPHYICALIACVTGFLLLSESGGVMTVVLAAVCFASAVGSGSFVALVFAVFLMIWMLLNIRSAHTYAIAGVLACVFSLPYLMTLRGPAQNVGGAALLKFAVRYFVTPRMPPALSLLALPLNYFLELGFFGACAVIGYGRKLVFEEVAQDGRGIKRAARSFEEFFFCLAARVRALCVSGELAQDGRGVKRAARSFAKFFLCLAARIRALCALNEWMLMVMAATSILLCTFIKSGATPNNDFGWRGFLVAQFALLILSAAYLEQTKLSGLLRVLLILGVAGTGYDLLLTRFFPMLSDANRVAKIKWLSVDEKLGERTWANREAYSWLQKHSSESALIGQNPDVDSVDIFSGLYGDRKIVAGDRSCTIGFGGSAGECAPIEALLTRLFKGEAQLGDACAALPASFYIVKDTDKAWKLPNSWVWRERPVFANSFVRIFSCGGLQAP